MLVGVVTSLIGSIRGVRRPRQGADFHIGLRYATNMVNVTPGN